MFKARKVPGIEDLVGTSGYAIIFSVQGPRSAADTMAGGDLDGDPYWVCFNEEVGLALTGVKAVQAFKVRGRSYEPTFKHFFMTTFFPRLPGTSASSA